MNEHAPIPRSVIITGAGHGIGAATAALAARHGWHVLINFASDAQAADQLRDEIVKGGGNADCFKADISDENSVMALFEFADGIFEPHDGLGGLINNAGILESQMKLVDMDGGRIDRVFATNVRGSFLCAREAVKRMSTAGGGAGGSIVNVSSAASRLGSAGEYIDYAATKGAIDTMTIGLAREVAGEGIRVNAVRPGFIETRIHAMGGQPDRLQRIRKNIPMNRPGQASEVAEAIYWLLDQESSYCTGALVDCAGGR